MGHRRFSFIFSIICVFWLLPADALLGQPRVQLPSESPYYPSTSPTYGYGAPTAGVPYGTAPTYTTPAATSFDPYFRPSTPAPMFNSPNWNLGNLGNIFNWNSWSQSSAPVLPLGPANYPTYVPPGTTPSFTSAPTNPWPQTPGYYPNSVYPNSTPNVLFPGTSNPPQYTNWNYNNPYAYPSASPYNWNNWWNTTTANVGYGSNQVVRLCQGARLRHTWLSGTDGFNSKEPNSLEINDTDVSLVFAIPNFFNSTRSLYIIPSYSHHLWDGPRVAGSDLPSKAFSGFLDTGWDTNPLQTLGIELGGRVGVFSDFESVSSDSIRLQGKVLGRLRLTPTSTLRFGVFYLDRNKIKLLPAGGLLWTPNQDSRFDLSFPEPKLSHYVSTLGNTDVWWYLHGYYGGGAWTIQRVDQTEDEIDINDIRIMIGMEFGRSEQIRQGFRLGFVEAGYAFDRELIFRYNGANNLELDNSIILRAGFAY